ncbi:hypothetical protein BS297_25655 [Rhodococcus erythropolis]|uniref:Plasmid maintenance system killer protein n=1 Tax=Rhodococcus erythropolis TaxID=1833 RepID=A0A5N5DWJ0_RHOER|nr:hypothetical protein BS297_25655 [Rhodococcus erythropolis]
MEYQYHDERIKASCESDRWLARNLGPSGQKNMDRRINEIEAATNIVELLEAPTWHVLDGRDGGARRGRIAGKLTGRYRLILSAPEGGVSGLVVTVEILDIEDYHKQ